MAALSNIGNTAVALAPANTIAQSYVQIWSLALTNNVYIGYTNTVTAALANATNTTQDNTCGTPLGPNSTVTIPVAAFRDSANGNTVADASKIFVIADNVGPVRIFYRVV